VVDLVDVLAADQYVTDADRLVAEIMRRETEGSTSLGSGLAIPHARFDSVREVRLAAATLVEPVPGTDPEVPPVDVVILLVGPREDPRQMLRILARLARLVKRPGFLDELRAAGDAAAMRRVLADAESTRV
jgi:mannitol/fructose-specific phosphotransferase system IIA component (Ntr-type)